MVGLWLAALAAFALMAAAGVSPVEPALVGILVVLVTGGLGLVLVRRERAGDWPRSWTYLELGLIVLAGGSLLQTRHTSGSAVIPSPTAFVALAGAVLAGLGFALFLESRMPGRALGVVFEALMCVVALGLVAWGALVINNGAPLETALALLPLVANGVLLWLAVRLIGVLRSESVGYAYIVGALLLLLAVDAIIAIGAVGDLHVSPDRVQLLRLTCFCILAAAALHPSLRRPFHPMVSRPTPLGAGRVAATLGLTLLAPALFALQGAAGLSPTLPVLLVGSSILPFLVALYLVRQVQDGASAEHRAQHDPLTGLPNRVLFLDRLELALATARRNGTGVGVMFLDLDRFKGINDSLGHSVGNQLLQCVAERLQTCVRESDTVARMGGDEFMVLLSSVDGEADCVTRRREAAQRLRRSVHAGIAAGRDQHQHRHRHRTRNAAPTPTPS